MPTSLPSNAYEVDFDSGLNGSGNLDVLNSSGTIVGELVLGWDGFPAPTFANGQLFFPTGSDAQAGIQFTGSIDVTRTRSHLIGVGTSADSQFILWFDSTSNSRYAGVVQDGSSSASSNTTGANYDAFVDQVSPGTTRDQLESAIATATNTHDGLTVFRAALHDVDLSAWSDVAIGNYQASQPWRSGMVWRRMILFLSDTLPTSQEISDMNARLDEQETPPGGGLFFEEDVLGAYTFESATAPGGAGHTYAGESGDPDMVDVDGDTALETTSPITGSKSIKITSADLLRVDLAAEQSQFAVRWIFSGVDESGALTNVLANRREFIKAQYLRDDLTTWANTNTVHLTSASGTNYEPGWRGTAIRDADIGSGSVANTAYLGDGTKSFGIELVGLLEWDTNTGTGRISISDGTTTVTSTESVRNQTADVKRIEISPSNFAGLLDSVVILGVIPDATQRADLLDPTLDITSLFASATDTVTPSGAASVSVAAEGSVSQTHAVTPAGAASVSVAAEGSVSQTHIVVPSGAASVSVAAEGSVTVPPEAGDPVCTGLTLTDFSTPLQVKNYGSTTLDAVFCADALPFPATPAVGVLWENGGSGTGSLVAVLTDDDWLRIRFGDGGVFDAAPSSQIDTDVSHIDIPTRSGPLAPFFDGGLHSVAWEINMSTYVLRFWVDEVLIGTSDSPPAGGSGHTGVLNNWGGGASGGYLSGSSQNTDNAVGTEDWAGGTVGASNLNFYSGQLSSWTPGASPDEVTPAGAASVSVAAEGSVSQVHALTPAGAASTSVAAEGSVAQAHVLTPAGAASTSVAAEGSLSQTHVVAPSGAASVGVAAEGTLAQTHVVTPLGAASLSVAAEATLAQAHVVTPAGAASVSVAASGSVSQAHIIQPAGAASISVAGEGTLAQTHIVEPAGAASVSVAAENSLSQVHELVASGAASLSVAASGTLSQTHIVTGTGAASVSVAAEGSVSTTVTDVVTASGAASVSVAAEGTLSQVHAVQPSGAASVSVAAEGSVAQVHEIQPSGGASISVAAEGTLVLGASVTATGAASVSVSAEGSVFQVHIVQPAGAASASVSATGSVAQGNVITSTGAASVSVAAEGSVSQTHVVVPAGAASVSVAAEGAVRQLHTLTASGGQSLSFAGHASVTQGQYVQAQGAVSLSVAAEGSVSVGGASRYWDGTAWQTGTVKYYNGTSWQTGTLKYFDGTNWV